MNYLNPKNIDFAAFEKRYPEHAKVIPAWAYADTVVDAFHGAETTLGLGLPWSKTHSHIRLRPGEVSVWSGINGSGKSLLLNQVMLTAMVHGERCVLASMEMQPHTTLSRLTRQAVGVRAPSETAIRTFHRWTDGKLWLYVQQGTVDSKRMLSVLRYCHEALRHEGEKVRLNHFVVDSLMKCGIAPDDFNRQKAFVDELCTFARDSGIHVHLVAHERKGESSRNLGDKFSIKGTSEISDQVDNIFIVWRNKDKEEEAQVPSPNPAKLDGPDAVVRCDKQRHGEWEGKILLWYDRDSLQYVAAEGLRPIPYIDKIESQSEALAKGPWSGA
jgi:twinkle protein